MVKERFAYAAQFENITVQELREEPLYGWMDVNKDPSNMFVFLHVDRCNYQYDGATESGRFILGYTDLLRKYQEVGEVDHIPAHGKVYSQFCIFALGNFNRRFAVTGTVRNMSALDALRFYVPGQRSKVSLLEQLKSDSGKRKVGDKTTVVARPRITLAEWHS